MPDPSLSPAIIEARAVCPTDVFEIETLEIRHPDVIDIKDTLEVCFLVDTYSASAGYTTVAERVLSQVTAINSDLLKKYTRVKWSLVTISGAEWTFETGDYFATLSQFLSKVANVVFTNNSTHGQIYEPTKDLVSRLNWSVNDALVARHVVYIGDTPNLTTTVEEIEVYHNGNSAFTSYTKPPASDEGVRLTPLTSVGAAISPNLTSRKWNNVGQTLTISGSTNPELNGTFTISAAYSEHWFLSPNILGINEFQADITIQGTHTRPLVPFADDPTLAITALNEGGIIFNQLPTFANADLTSIVTQTNGVSLSEAQLASDQLVRENLVNSLFTFELIDSGISSIFLVNDTRPHSLPIETGEMVDFETRGFKLRFAGSGENGLQNLSITIDDIDRKVSQFVAKAKRFTSPVELVFRVYLSDDLTSQQNDPPTILYLTSTSNSSEGFAATATTIDVVNAPFPNAYYRLENFPLA